MLSLAGSLLIEISLPKLIIVWLLLLVVPGLLLGLAPMLVTSWLGIVANKIMSLVIGLWSVLLLVGVLALGWFGWRSLFRIVEKNFWALNSVVVEPGYAATREAFRHIAERLFAKHATDTQRARVRAACAAIAGIVVSALAVLVLLLVWPSAHLVGDVSELRSWTDLAPVALANSVVVLTGYFAVAALIWGFADAAMPQPRDFKRFEKTPPKGRTWRVAHLSDIHVVGERYGFRIESGRSGPRGNDRLKRLLDQLEDVNAKRPLDTILITGDETDAGISTEWSELFDAFGAHPPCSAHPDLARQPRSQHRGPRQSRAHGPTHEPRPALAADQNAVRHGRHPGPARAGRRSGDWASRGHSRGIPETASR
ncbi:MAG: metallophosphoesterase [Methyloceanibacter sp.]